jgi:predicted O-methyltransferase YrrM
MVHGSTLLGLLPLPLQDWLRRTRDVRRLSTQPSIACDTSALAPIDEGRLRELLGSGGAGGDWDQVTGELEALGITDAADGVNRGDRRALYQLIRSLRPARVLEVGTHIGASTAHIAAALRENHRAGAAPASFTTVDIADVNHRVAGAWVAYGARHSPAALVEALGMAEHTRFVAQPSLDFLKVNNGPWDFIFLDGDHTAANVYRELPAALARLAPGGFILLHDYFPRGATLWQGDPVVPGVFLATERLKSEGVGLEVLPLGELPWTTKLGQRVTSLACVVPADRVR